MVIDYGILQFAAPPCTGEDWFIRAMESAGFGTVETRHVHEEFIRYSCFPMPLSVSLVCHPCMWLARAYCTVTISHADDPATHALRLQLLSLNKSSFDAFVVSWLTKMP